MMKPSRIQHINPLIVVPVLLKKVAVTYAAQSYGYDRIYRLVLRGLKSLVPNKNDQMIIQTLIKDSMRMPTKTLNLIQSQEAMDFFKQYSDKLYKEEQEQNTKIIGRRNNQLKGRQIDQRSLGFLRTIFDFFRELSNRK